MFLFAGFGACGVGNCLRTSVVFLAGFGAGINKLGLGFAAIPVLALFLDSGVGSVYVTSLSLSSSSSSSSSSKKLKSIFTGCGWVFAVLCFNVFPFNCWSVRPLVVSYAISFKTSSRVPLRYTSLFIFGGRNTLKWQFGIFLRPCVHVFTSLCTGLPLTIEKALFFLENCMACPQKCSFFFVVELK